MLISGSDWLKFLAMLSMLSGDVISSNVSLSVTKRKESLHVDLYFPIFSDLSIL